MARPTQPLIDRETVIATALELIDAAGLEGFTVRGLASALGVNPASLYHHFRDKQEILDGVRTSIALDSDIAAVGPDDEPWQDRIRVATLAYRDLLLSHPNVAPLMRPDSADRGYALGLREPIAAKLLRGGVPERFVYPIIDSVELLAYASAVINPAQLAPARRLEIRAADAAPALARAVGAAPTTASEVFESQLDALIDGWTERAGQPGTAPGAR